VVTVFLKPPLFDPSFPRKRETRVLKATANWGVTVLPATIYEKINDEHESRKKRPMPLRQR